MDRVITASDDFDTCDVEPTTTAPAPPAPAPAPEPAAPAEAESDVVPVDSTADQTLTVSAKDVPTVPVKPSTGAPTVEGNEDDEDDEEGEELNDEDIAAMCEPDVSTVCVICMEGHRTHAVVPCGHQCLCTECSTDEQVPITKCPVCCGAVGRLLRIYA